MNTSSEHLPKRAKTAALRQVQVCFHSANALRVNCLITQYVFYELIVIKYSVSCSGDCLKSVSSRARFEPHQALKPSFLHIFANSRS